MYNSNPWILLGIEPTLEETEIRRAYARQLKNHRPDEDPDGFQRLVAARNAALGWQGPLPGQPEANDLQDADGEDGEEDWEGRQENHETSEEASGAPLRLTPTPELVVLPPGEAGDPLDPPPADNDVPPPADEEEARKEPPQLEEATPELSVEEQAQALLRRLLGLAPAGNRGYASGVLWEVSAWQPLFKLADQLSFEARARFRQTFVAEFLKRLPAPNRHEEGLYDFSVGSGISAVVEYIEAECQLADEQTELARRHGANPVHIYMRWLATAGEARGVFNRPGQGRKAYWSEKGQPRFSGRDRQFAIPAKLSGWLTQSMEAGRWLRNFKPFVLLLPGAQAAQIGLAPIGALFVLVNIAWLLLSNGATRTGILIAGGGLLAILALRVAAAFQLPRLGVIMAVARIRSADRYHMWGDERRYAALRPKNTDRTVILLGIGDIISMAFVLGLIVNIMIPAWRLGDDRNQPPEQLWSRLFQSVLDDGAVQDRRDTGTLVDIVAKLTETRDPSPRQAAASK